MTTSDILEAMSSSSADESNFRTVRSVLVDFTNCDLVATGVSDAVRLADKNAELAKAAPGVRVAMVASNENAGFIFRMWECLLTVNDRTTRLFRTRAEAEAWLGAQVPEPVGSPTR